MAEITAALVKELREKSGAGMMDCKKALAETGGDMEAAVDWLRKKGLSAAAKKAGRVAAEGLVGVATRRTARRGGRGQRRDRLRRPQRAVPGLRRRGRRPRARRRRRRRGAQGDALPRHPPPVADELTQLVATIGENMKLRRASGLTVERRRGRRPTCTTPLARASARSACWWRSKAAGDAGAAGRLGRQIAMHVAAPNPQALDIDDVDPAGARARERRPHRAGPRLRQARGDHRQDGRGPDPQVLRGSGAAGAGLRHDGESRVKAVVEAQGAGAPNRHRLRPLALGEGIEKPRPTSPPKSRRGGQRTA